MWIRNAWYVIAWEHEVPAQGLFARTVLGEPIVVFRADGGLVALHDRCCHRAVPLSAGRHEGDGVRCGYHGLKFDAKGRCVEIPGSAKVPAHVCVRRYPLAVRNRWVFVWMGDPARADTASLPDNFSCDSPDWQYKPGYMHYDTPYLLICDNLLDFSHLSYVHASTLGGTTAIAHARPVIEDIDRDGQRGIRVARHVPDVPAPPYYQRFRRFDTHVDRWFDYDFLLPATLLMKSGGRPVDDPPDDLSRAVQLHSCQTLTPETEHSTHYFFQQAHPTRMGDATVTESIYQSLLTAFHEDREMIRAQHRALQATPDAPMMPMPMDAALLRFRRLVAERVEAERAADAAGAAAGSRREKP
jgi:vanillate O-demethylase monooxygenase subunit